MEEQRLNAIIRGYAELQKEVPFSRTQLWRLIREQTFPAPILLSRNSLGWYRHEVEAWLAARPRRTYRNDDNKRDSEPPSTTRIKQ
ncbi:MAG: helix-turn-helix transcriptional regulator [Blastocatellia bacterium]